VRHETQYQAVKILSAQKHYSIQKLCRYLKINRSAYYKWLHRKTSLREDENRNLIELIKEEYEEKNGILGYRQMTIIIRRDHHKTVNYKRIYRLMHLIGLKSVCRKKKYNYRKSTPEVTAENILNRNFKADHPNEKWLTDVTEFKYGISGQKAYLSAILDLGDRHIVSFVLGHRNNNKLVFDTFDKAIELNSYAKPLFHSDRGFQYTSKKFKLKLDKSGMTQSMSRVGRCIDNGPMEGFWGMLKSEMYYLNHFTDYESLQAAIENYIEYYNNKRYQKRLNCMTPMEFNNYLQAA